MAFERLDADSAKIRQFATDLATFQKDVAKIALDIELGLQHLSKTWQDDEYQRFVEHFKKIQNTLDTYLEKARKMPASLNTYADQLDSVHGGRLPS